MIFRQLYDSNSSTYTYLLADETSHEAILIDPVFEQNQRDLAMLNELELNLKLVLDTHAHADHVTAAWLLKQKTGCQTGLAAAVGASHVDVPLQHGDIVGVDGIQLEVRATPGHTDGCLSYVLDDHSMVFTGDTLLIRGCGRSDFQQGDAGRLFKSITEQLFTLPDACMVYPAHDYSGRTVSSIGEEKQFNSRVGGGASENDFVQYMNAMQLPHPRMIDEALPANMRSGMPADGKLPEEPDWADLRINFAGVPEVQPDWVIQNQPSITILDVREREEIQQAEQGIENAVFIPLSELRERVSEVPVDKPVVTLCRSGRRSSLAVNILKNAGHEKVANIHGGLLNWQSG